MDPRSGDSRYSVHQRVFMALEYGRTLNYAETGRRYGIHFDTNELPNKITIKRWYENFLNTGSVLNHYEGHAPTVEQVVTAENIEKVHKVFADDPEMSICKAAAITGLTYYCIQKILSDKLGFKPYKISVLQPLDSRAISTRLNFSEEVLSLINAGQIDTNRIWFSDEAHFWLHGYVNRQNFRFWASEKPNFVMEKPLHPKKISVWMAVSGGGKTPAIIFEDTVTSASYAKLLKEEFIPWLDDKGEIDDYWFMQDGAPPHRTKEVLEVLKCNEGHHFENVVN